MAGSSPGISLGNRALRGERGVLQVPAAELLRLRYNPFHSYLENRMLAFMGFEPGPESVCAPVDAVAQILPLKH